MQRCHNTKWLEITFVTLVDFLLILLNWNTAAMLSFLMLFMKESILYSKNLSGT